MFFNGFFVAAGLINLVHDFINNYLGPVYIGAVAVFAIVFIKDREFRKLFSYIGIATIVALLIYTGDFFFGPSGKLTNAAKGIAEKVNVVMPVPTDLLTSE